MKNFRFTLVLAIALSGLNLLASSASAESAHQPSTVVELFTSQGCSSCPPADKLLGELVQDEDVLGLSFAVTYWDYIGWKDTFGDAANNERQASYKNTFNSRYVYTPQMVIGGKSQLVGSDSSGVKALIAENAGHALSFPLTWSFNGDKLDVMIPDGEGEATIWLVDLNHMADVDISRGENSGRIITYHNIVRHIRSIGEWNGTAKTVVLDLAEMRQSGRDGCALIIQKSGYGPILAALNVSL